MTDHKQFTAERWAELADTIGMGRPFYPEDRACHALLRYLDGVRMITGIPLMPLIEGLVEEKDPLLVELLWALTRQKDRRRVLTQLFTRWNTRWPC